MALFGLSDSLTVVVPVRLDRFAYKENAGERHHPQQAAENHWSARCPSQNEALTLPSNWLCIFLDLGNNPDITENHTFVAGVFATDFHQSIAVCAATGRIAASTRMACPTARASRGRLSKTLWLP